MAHLSCVEPQSPHHVDLTSYVSTSPALHTSETSGSVFVTLGGVEADSVLRSNEPIQLLIRTTRGVRITQFGNPPDPKLDAKGIITNYVTHFLDDCIPVLVDPWVLKFHRYNPAWTPDPPPIWWNVLDQVAAVEVGLIRVSNVGPGEIISLDQKIDGGVSLFSRNSQGPMTIPYAIPLRSDDVGGATLQKLNRTPIGDISMQSKMFQRVAVLETPGALSHALATDGKYATITSEYHRMTVTTNVGPLGITKAVTKKERRVADAASEGQTESALSVNGILKDPYKPGKSSWKLDLPGVVNIHPIPGFENEKLVIAELDDGTFRSFIAEKDSTAPLMSGTLARWIKMAQVAGEWAINTLSGDRLALFRVSEFVNAKDCCDKCAGRS